MTSKISVIVETFERGRADGVQQEARDVAAYLAERRADLMALAAKRQLSAGEADLVGRMLDALASSFAAGVHRTGEGDAR
jgi:hypothetical protein